MALTFRGGIHHEEEALTANLPIKEMPSPDSVTLSLSGHGADVAKPLVAVGDRVLKGQKIADGEGNVSPIHASISGTVSAIGTFPTPSGEEECIVLQNDYKEELSPEVTPFDTPIGKAEPEALIRHIREKGIVGLGGTGFPTWAKLEEAQGKVTRLIVNCAECEPYLTGIHRLLLEKTEEVVGGVKILMRAAGVEKAVFALEDDTEDAADALLKLVRNSKNFAVAVLKTKYPQGDERQLVRTLLRKEIPKDDRPTSVGAIVFNAETCWAVYRAFVSGMPATTRLLTVSGDCVKEPANLLIPMGTSFRAALDFCGGFSTKPDKLLSGGPMMGHALWSTAVPVTKKVGGILAITAPLSKASPCIHCGRCVKACPLQLIPSELYRSVEKGDMNTAKFYDIDLCNDCGCCTYVCPAGIPILQNIRVGKEILAKKRG